MVNPLALGNLECKCKEHMRRTVACVMVGILGASAVFGSSVPAFAGASDGHAVVVGEGWTDPSTLDVVGWESDPGSAPSGKPPKPRAIPFDKKTVVATCGGRKDWYRIINWDGRTKCFSNKGEIYKTYLVLGAKFLCPGNNIGASYYRQRINEAYRWSV